MYACPGHNDNWHQSCIIMTKCPRESQYQTGERSHAKRCTDEHATTLFRLKENLILLYVSKLLLLQETVHLYNFTLPYLLPYTFYISDKLHFRTRMLELQCNI